MTEQQNAIVDEFGTDADSLVPMDLSPEPPGFGVRYGYPVTAEPAVAAPEADLSGEPVYVVDEAIDFDLAADLALLRETGDRADA